MEEIIEQQNVPPVSESVPVKNIFKVVLFVLVAVFFGASLVFAGIEIGKKQISPNSVPNTNVTTEPTVPPPNETANWKTYINSNAGFSFKYPRAWTENGPVSKEDTTIVYIYADEKFGEMPDPLQYYVWVSEINKLPNLDYAKESVGKYTAYKTDKLPSRFGALSYLITKDRSKYVEISITPYDSTKPYPAQERYIGVFNQIISTFKFTTGQNSVDETANWKTYTDTENNYSLKYPQFLSFYKIGEKSVLFKDMRDSNGLESNSLEVDVAILDNSLSLDAKSFVDKIINDKNVSSGGRMISISEQPELMKNIQRSSMTVDGVTSEKIIGLPSQSGAVEIYILQGNKMYHMWMQPYEAKNPSQEQKEYAKIFDQILSTFKFTD